MVTHSVKRSLLAAFRYLLKPLVRMAVKNGVQFPEFSMALKQAYVDVASRQIRTSDTDVTDEGIAVIANLETREVKEVLQLDASANFELAAQVLSPLPRALEAWHTDASFTGPYGVLRDLQFSRLEGDRSEGAAFSDLADKYCPGVPAQALLDELIRTKCVERVGNGFYRAVTRSYVPDPLSAESIRLVARVVHNLCETLEFNQRPESAQRKGLIERTVFNRRGLSRKAFQEFDRFMRDRWQGFADDIDNWLSANEEKDGAMGAIRTGVGFYHYVVNEDDDSAFSKELPIEGD